MTLCCVPSKSPGLLYVAVRIQVVGGGERGISAELCLPRKQWQTCLGTLCLALQLAPVWLLAAGDEA